MRFSVDTCETQASHHIRACVRLICLMRDTAEAGRCGAQLLIASHSLRADCFVRYMAASISSRTMLGLLCSHVAFRLTVRTKAGRKCALVAKSQVTRYVLKCRVQLRTLCDGMDLRHAHTSTTVLHEIGTGVLAWTCAHRSVHACTVSQDCVVRESNRSVLGSCCI